ncbi:hypothetical protein K3725_11955 [Leisingera sp. S132]|uniref:hypothetical protein n=1 Tax=Leisingera sp. S132 TaxID=2867016 RepID=UPI0021A4B60D|nr:hypothetical protein [Leisingera sp. S132]UWQ78027.1 hypothetical protein K3725_11955 [Leisingera sp. S132]
MSDPVTHAEIEDVLSSIRRLVSNETQEQPAAPEPAARLVLTPALRVQQSAPRSTLPSEDTAAPSSQPETQSKAERQPAVPYAASDAGTAAGDAASLLAEEPSLAFRHHRELSLSRRNAAAADPSGTEQADTEHADPEQADSEQADTGLAEPEPAKTELSNAELANTELANTDAPWGDPETTLFEAAAGTSRPGVAAADEAGMEAEAEAADRAPVLLKDGGRAGGTAGARAASVVRKIAEMEARSSAAQDRPQQHWEPDSQTEAPFAGAGPDTIEWRDEPLPPRRGRDAEEEILDIPETFFEPETAATPGDPEAVLDPGTAAASAETAVEEAVTAAAMDTLAEEGDSYLDEDALRDLVASIVREELQGPLGERITRNVRKLVRREIQRALAAHDLL